MLGIENSGGEGGIRLPPFLASTDESCTSAIILFVLAGYKPIDPARTVSTVSVIPLVYRENGITGISWKTVRDEN